MSKIVISIDGVVIREAFLDRERMSLGRRPYNDIVINNLAVSGEHAVFNVQGDDVNIEDVGSTNGTYVNGVRIKLQKLSNGDTINIGKYRIKFFGEEENGQFEATTLELPPSLTTQQHGFSNTAKEVARPTPLRSENWRLLKASLKVCSGPFAGREVPLTKVVTTIGKPGVVVASVTKRTQGFVLCHVFGNELPTVNGAPMVKDPVILKNGDVLELSGIQMEFVQEAPGQ